MRFILYFSIICQKLHSSAKKYKRKCIDKALSVYLKEAGYIFDGSSVEKVFDELGLAQL